MTDVWKLTDQELVVAAALIHERSEPLEIPLTNWERTFAEGVVKGYRTYGHISWKQRRHLREIVEKSTKLLKHRADFDVALREAMAR